MTANDIFRLELAPVTFKAVAPVSPSFPATPRTPLTTSAVSFKAEATCPPSLSAPSASSLIVSEETDFDTAPPIPTRTSSVSCKAGPKCSPSFSAATQIPPTTSSASFPAGPKCSSSFSGKADPGSNICTRSRKRNSTIRKGRIFWLRWLFSLLQYRTFFVGNGTAIVFSDFRRLL
uniref:Uncharacterized protein n=1 Tax=Schistocephalus solidus TaxID=70667 RepID=A0A0V0J487_SCHSO